jgi:abortive infection bacteriophage resistance protein
MLSYFYGDLPASDQKRLAKELFATTSKNLVSWLRCCTDLRNICAHYGRLYFRIFTAIPANLSGLEKQAERRLFGAVLTLKALYPDTLKWSNEIYPELCALIKSYSHEPVAKVGYFCAGSCSFSPYGLQNCVSQRLLLQN